MAEKLKINGAKLAEWWGISAPRISTLMKEGKIPNPSEDGKWDWPDINIYYINELKERKNGLPTGLTNERIRLTKINADKKQFELEKARGDVIDRALAMKLWSMVMQNIINKIEIIPAKLPPLAHGLTIPEIKAVVEKMIYEVRNEIANPDLEEVARLGGHHRIVKHGKGKSNSNRVGVGRQKQDVKPRGKRGAGEVVHGEGGVSKADDGCV